MDTSVLIVVLLLIHIGGAIIGFGPTYAYAILGPMAPAVGPQGGVAIMESMVAIEKKLVMPVAVVTQPLSGLALIFVAGYAADFLSHVWLWVAILLYAAAFYIGIFVQTPLLERMIHAAKSGPPTPEFAAMAKRSAALGPVLTVLLTLVVILMVVKPGG